MILLTDNFMSCFFQGSRLLEERWTKVECEVACSHSEYTQAERTRRGREREKEKRLISLLAANSGDRTASNKIFEQFNRRV